MADTLEKLYGRVVAMSRQTHGSILTAAASIAATVLAVASTDDFDVENGGQVVIDGEVYDYVEVDEDSLTITLDTGLLAAADEDTFVELFDPEVNGVVVEYVADVLLDDQDPGDEPIEVTVQHGLVNMLAESVRGGAAEAVVLIRDGDDDWVIWQIDGKLAVDVALEEAKDELGVALEELNVDLAELNDVTLPAVQSDLSALNTSLGTLNGKFPITSTSISDGAITTPKMTANSINGDRILANTLHADKIVANSITGDKVQANSIGADKIVANSIGADRLSANAINSMTITGATIRTASAGSTRVELSSAFAHGISFYDGASLGGTLYFNVATDSMEWTNSILGRSISMNSVGIALTAPRVSTSGEIHAGSSFYDDSLSGGGGTGANINDNGKIIRTPPSSRKFKTDIVPLDVDPAAVLSLEGVTFRYKDTEKHGDGQQVGLIAEDLDAAGFGEFVTRDRKGEVTGILYDRLVVTLLPVLRDLTARIEALEAAD